MFSRYVGLRCAKRHNVLELIAKAVSTAHLVAGRSRPYSARERLVKQPAVQQKVHRTIRRSHLNRTEDVVPKPGNRAQFRVEIGGSIPRDQCNRFSLCRCFPEKEDDLGRFVWRKLYPGLQSATGIETGADTTGERLRVLQCSWMIQRAVR